MSTIAVSPSTTTAPNFSSSSSSLKTNPLVLRPSQVSLLGSSRACRSARKSWCKAAKKDEKNQYEPQNADHKSNKLDRRNMLLGLGGLYGAATTLGGLTPSSLADPAVLDLKAAVKCERALKDDTTPRGMKCCPPDFKESEVINFDPRNYWSPGLRVRPAAHKVSPQYAAKFREAVRRMKLLPEDDPRSFAQQAKIHCAYCNGAYHIAGTTDNDHRLQVHGSWLFLPFHRAYLFFFERILGSLVNDPSFAIPYWNWDHPDGMYMPSIYTQDGLSNPLYDDYRDEKHFKSLIDLGYGGDEIKKEDNTKIPEENQIFYNLWHMHVHVARPKEAELFMGGRYAAKDKYSINSPGTIERVPHTPVHIWVGDPEREYSEDMGSFYSAGRDPLFYAHHANVDRTWTIWKGLDGGRKEFDEADFLNNFFIFYDEKKKPVKIYVKDVLDEKILGYKYETSDTPWLDPLHPVVDHKPLPIPPAVPLKFPLPLGISGFQTKVPRPENRVKDSEEILEIKVQQKASKKYIKFDVYLFDEHNHKTPDGKTKSAISYVGSCTELPHQPHEGHKTEEIPTKTLLMPISEVIKNVGAENDDYVTVAFQNITGELDSIDILGIKIRYL
uniref:Tyrosinase copper-binding domain-containing protein n=1 Tax=Portulaca oleracea TaxID=46147 RepID=I4DD55_POROL|nr:hypothetical protein [Portulaca oleracea]